MSFGHTTQYQNQGDVIPKRVWFSGTNAPLTRGTGVCYDYAYVTTATGETATDSNAFRSKVVALPSTTNNHRFAGVVASDHKAKASGQWIDIFEPGSVCEVAVGADTVINTSFLTCSAGGGDVGLFSRSGLPGRGSMVPLQTTTLDVSVTNGSGSITGATITDTGAFGSVVADDLVYVVGGAVTATGTADATGVFGKFLVQTAAANTLVLKAAQGHDNTAATAIAPNFTSANAIDYYTMSGQQMCLCYLMTGEESGLQEYLNIDDVATPIAAMPNGTTYIGGGGVTAGANTVNCAAQNDGLLFKRFVCIDSSSTATKIAPAAGITYALRAWTQTVNKVWATLTCANNTHAVIQFDPLGQTAHVQNTDMTEA